MAASSKVQLGGMLCNRAKGLCSYEKLQHTRFFYCAADYLQRKKTHVPIFWPVLLGHLAIGCYLHGIL